MPALGRAPVFVGLVAALLSVALVFAVGPRSEAELMVDAPSYDRVAQGLLAGEGFRRLGDPLPEIVRTPGYPGFLAVSYGVFGRSFRAVGLVQAVLHGLAALLFALSAKRLFASQSKLLLVSYGLLALYPLTAWAAVRIYSETLSELWAALALWGAVHLDDGRKRSLVATAVGCAALMLTRPSWLLLPLVFVAAHLWARRPMRRVFLATALAYVLILPWGIRTSLIAHRPVPLGGGLGFRTQLFFASQEYRDLGRGLRKFLGDPELKRSGAHEDEAAFRALKRAQELEAAAFAPEKSPEWYARLDALRGRAAARAIGQSPLSYLVGSGIRAVKLWIGIWQKGWPRPLALAARGASILLFVAALVGGWRWRKEPLVWLVAAPLIYLTATHAWIHAEARFSYPVRGAMLILAAASLARPPRDSGRGFGAGLGGEDPLDVQRPEGDDRPEDDPADLLPRPAQL